MAQKSTPKTKQVRRTRSPNGMVKEKPVAVRFALEEHTLISDLADKEQRSVASVVRLATLRGLAEYEKDRLALTK